MKYMFMEWFMRITLNPLFRFQLELEMKRRALSVSTGNRN